MKEADNLRIRVYEMAHLPREVRERFHSDMRIVVDYLAEGKNYCPTEQKIIHMEAFLRMMKVLTGDDRYNKMMLETAREEREENISMCELLDKYWNDGVETGMARGRAEGKAEGKAEEKAESVGFIRSMHKNKLSAETIARLVDQKSEYINRIISLCSQYPAEDNFSIAKRLLSIEC